MSSYPPPPSQGTQARIGLPALPGEDGGSYALRYQESRPVPDPPGMLWRGVARMPWGNDDVHIAVCKGHVAAWYGNGEWWLCSNGDEEERADIYKAWAIDVTNRAKPMMCGHHPRELHPQGKYCAACHMVEECDKAIRQRDEAWDRLRALGVEP